MAIKNPIYGVSHTNMDKRRRIILPAKLRAALPSTLLITIESGLSCLRIYTEISWREFVEEMASHLGSSRALVDWKRSIYPWVYHVDIASDGRILVPSPLVEYGQLSQSCILLGLGDHLELWDEARYHAHRKTDDVGQRFSGLESRVHNTIGSSGRVFLSRQNY